MLVARRKALAIFGRASTCRAVLSNLRLGHWHVNVPRIDWRQMSSERRPTSKAEAEAKVYTQRMTEAPSFNEFLAVLQEVLDRGIFNDFHASAAYHSLTIWQRRGELSKHERKNPVLDNLNHEFRVILGRGHVRPRATANVLWSVGHLSKRLPNFLDIVPVLVAEVPVVAKDMNAQGVSNCMLAAANLRTVTPDALKMVPPLVAQVPLIAKDMNPQHVPNCLWAAATLKEAAPDALKMVPALVTQVPVVADTMTAQGVSNSLWAVASLKTVAPNVLETVPVLVAQVSAIAKNMKAIDLSTCLCAAETLKEAAPDALKMVPALATQIPKMANSMNTQHVSNSLCAAAILKDDVPAVLKMVPPLVARIRKTMTMMNAESISNSLLGMVLLQDSPSHLAVDLTSRGCEVVEHFKSLLPKMSDNDLGRTAPIVLWAYAKMGLQDEELLALVSKHFRKNQTFDQSLSDWSICALQWSYEVLDSQKAFQDFHRIVKTEVQRRGLSEFDVQNSQPHQFHATRSSNASP